MKPAAAAQVNVSDEAVLFSLLQWQSSSSTSMINKRAELQMDDDGSEYN